MEIIDLNKSKINNIKENVIILGNFDGFHMGHLSLIEKAKEIEMEKGYLPSCLLFKEHPSKILKGSKDFYFINSTEDKIEILEELGIKLVFLVSFDEEFIKTSKEDFVENFLYKKMGVKSIVVGEDYTFAYKASGKVKDLEELGSRYGIETNIVKDKSFDGEKVSSSIIRKNILDGNISYANKLLTRPYFIRGRIVSGEGRGRKLGFPTANIQEIDTYLIPHEGVYATILELDSKKYLSMTSVGTNPTFDGKKTTVEANILDFNEDIYGREVRLYFLDRLRFNEKYDKVEDLIKQMEVDKIATKEIGKLYNF